MLLRDAKLTIGMLYKRGEEQQERCPEPSRAPAARARRGGDHDSRQRCLLRKHMTLLYYGAGAEKPGREQEQMQFPAKN